MKEKPRLSPFGEFIHRVMQARNVRYGTLAALLRTTPVVLRCACTSKLNPIPSVWKDRLVEALYLNLQEEEVLTAQLRKTNNLTRYKVKRSMQE